MTDKYAPSRYWIAEKNGTAVKKFDTVGESRISLPDGIEAVSIDSMYALEATETDTSVLTDAEAEQLGIVQP